MTIGVAYRVEQLADREEGYVKKDGKKFDTLIPLHELISKVHGIKQLGSKKVWGVYNGLIKEFGSEFKILREVDEGSLSKVVGDKLAKVVMVNRKGELRIKPGYDGVYGEVMLDSGEKEEKKQKSLVDF